MSENELRLAIERRPCPGRLQLEPGLTELLLGDVAGPAGGPAAAPVHAMGCGSAAWCKRLTIAAYRAIGGVQGALERADKIVRGFSP